MSDSEFNCTLIKVMCILKEKKEHDEKGTWNKVINCEIRIRYMYLIHKIKNTGISLLYNITNISIKMKYFETYL